MGGNGADVAARRHPAAARGPRTITRRRNLPGGRAVFGGFLIAVAAVGIFAAYSSATARPRQHYVVAAHALTPGSRLSLADLRIVALDLPDPSVRAQVFASPSDLLGAGVVAPIASGSLIQASEVVGRAGAVGTREVSMSIDRSRAIAGTLKAGEYVDVLGTFGNGADAYTVVMLAHVQVIAIANQSSSLGDTHSQLITFAAPTETAAEAIADANVAAQVTLVRSAESTADSTPSPPAPAYRAPSGRGS